MVDSNPVHKVTTAQLGARDSCLIASLAGDEQAGGTDGRRRWGGKCERLGGGEDANR